MNLSKLFPMQKKLDERIVKEKGLEEQGLLPMKILALQVELGELANEWRRFKFWSEDREPRSEVLIECEKCGGSGRSGQGYYGYCGNCHGGYVGKENPLLEEYVDCLHFILSIVIDINKASKNSLVGIRYSEPSDEKVEDDDITLTFSMIFKNTWNVHADYRFLVGEFLDLGSMLGFTWDQIESAYFEKNKINHARQENGY